MLLISCLALLINSCKKDHPSSIDTTSKSNVTVEEAKSWLQKNEPSLDLGENWKHPITMTTGTGDKILKIRINESLYQKKTWVLRDILFQKDANGNIQSVGYKVFLDTSYFSNKKDANLPLVDKRELIQNADFTGKIILYTLNNEPIKGVDYINGRKIADLIIRNPKNSGFKIIMGQQPLEIAPTCYGSSLDDHQYCDGGGGPEDPPPFDGRQFIDPGSRDTPTPQPPDFTWLFPPTNPANTPAPDTGIPIGNPGSGGGNPSNLRDINNNIKDPCLAKTVDEALKANKSMLGVMADIVKNFDASKTIHINIYDGTTRDGTPAECKSTTIGNNFSAAITLQTPYFTNSSKESVVTALIHEFVHAYINSSGSNILNTTHHDQMSAMYIEPMATYLKAQFDLPLKDAYALAWSGVSDSIILQNATENTTFTMSDGNVITKSEIAQLSSPYKDNDPLYMKGHNICK